MNPVSAFVVFVIIWWTVIFCVLPIGVETEYKPEDEHLKGIAPSAPKKLNIKRKLILTTIISLVLWAIAYVIIVSDIIDPRHLALGE